jgi:hypothetical protein
MITKRLVAQGALEPPDHNPTHSFVKVCEDAGENGNFQRPEKFRNTCTIYAQRHSGAASIDASPLAEVRSSDPNADSRTQYRMVAGSKRRVRASHGQ